MIFAVVNAMVSYAIAEKSQKRKKGRPNRIRNYIIHTCII